jgi:hypothetical protein
LCFAICTTATEVAACAAAFFAYKAIAGYFYVQMSLSVSSDRVRTHPDKDILVVVAKLKKGDRGSVRLHDAQARITYDGQSQAVSFVGIHRLSVTTDRTTKGERRVVRWDKLSESQPLLRLPPDEETEFSCHAEVPKDAICVVEVTILGQERSWAGGRPMESIPCLYTKGLRTTINHTRMALR